MATFRTFAPFDNSVIADIKTWGQAFGQALVVNFAWAAQTGHGEVVASNVAGTWTWTTNPVLPTAATTTPRGVTNFRGAFSTANTYAVNDTATSGGLTFIATGVTPVLVLTSVATGTGVYTGTITGGNANAFAGHSFTIAGFTTGANNGTFTCTASTTTTLTLVNASSVNETHAATATDVTVPASNLLTWQPYNFEIFASTGAMTSALPIYLRIIYANTATAVPVLYVSVGTGVDAGGNLTGSVNLATSSPIGQGLWNGGGSQSTSSVFSMDFSGDADNFRMCPWRNLVAQGVGTAGSNGPSILVIDRAKTAAGTDADGYVYVGWLGMTASSAAYSLSGIILKTSLGGVVAQTSTTSWAGALATPTGVSLSNWGSSPAMPIFPLVGYAANPLLGAITVQAQDQQNGAVIPVWLYNGVHKYLVTGADTTLITYRQVNGISNTVIPAILWE